MPAFMAMPSWVALAAWVALGALFFAVRAHEYRALDAGVLDRLMFGGDVAEVVPGVTIATERPSPAA
jgi:hypothetical protein